MTMEHIWKVESLEAFEKDFKEINEEGTPIRTNYTWINQRFETEYGNEYKTKLWEFLRALTAINEDTLNSKSCLEWVNANPANKESVQEYWRKKPKEFIDLVKKLRHVTDSNLSAQLIKFASGINNDPLRYIYEIIQNADDCEYPHGVTPSITLELTDEGITVAYNEVGMLYSDVLAITTIGESNKHNRKNKRLIGEKGVGFKTIFSVCKEIEVYSDAFSFQLSKDSLQPKFIDPKSNQSGTALVLHLAKNDSKATDSSTDEKKAGGLDLNAERTFKDLLNKYGFQQSGDTWELDKQKAFQDCPVLFTNRLKSITLKRGDQSFTISNQEGKIIYKGNDTEVGSIEYYSMTKDVVLNYEQYCSRYPDQFSSEEEFNGLEDKTCITYPITILAAKDTQGIKEGCLYSYLPTSTKIKAPINIQLPVKLNLDRSCLFFIGDSDTNRDEQSKDNSGSPQLSAWSECMMTELYGLIPKFYDELKTKSDIDIFLYIPSFQDNNHYLFASDAKYSGHIEKLNKYCAKKMLFEVFQGIAYFKKHDSSEYCTAAEAVMFDKWVHENLAEEYFAQWDIRDQFLVEYAENAHRAKCVGFEQKIPGSDNKKTEYLNGVMEISDEYRRIILEEAVKDKNSKERSQYIPGDISGLCIFPARRFDESVQYLPYTGNAEKRTWFVYCEQEWAKTRRDSTICFLTINFPNSVKDIKIKFENATPENIWNAAFKDMGKEKFEDLMDLLYRMGRIPTEDLHEAKDWKEAIKQLLRSESVSEFWTGNSENNRKCQLIDYLVKNAQKFAEGE